MKGADVSGCILDFPCKNSEPTKTRRSINNGTTSEAIMGKDQINDGDF